MVDWRDEVAEAARWPEGIDRVRECIWNANHPADFALS